MLNTRALKPQSQTVSVYTRHKGECARAGDPHSRRCNCSKYLYLLKDGQRTTISAKTRSWSVAEEKAAAIRDSWDPVKLRLKELEQQQESKVQDAVTIEAALERWLKNVRSKDNSTATFSKYATIAKQIKAWTRARGLSIVSEISPDNLDEWKCSWSPLAEQREDRIGKTTAARRLELLKRFTAYCLRMGWLEIDPSLNIEAISPDGSVTLPLLEGRYEAVLEATYRYDEGMRPDDRYGPELRAIIQLMRWSGMRIGDALATERSGFSGNRLRFTIQKSRKPHTVIIPDHVVKLLFELPGKPEVDERYFFWSGKSLGKSLTGQWQRKLKRLNEYLTLTDYAGKPMRFHSHQLRDTFAVSHLLNGTSLEDVSLMLAHESVRVTEKFYAPWVPARQALLERKMSEGLERMGATVSL